DKERSPCHVVRCADRPASPSSSACTRAPSAPPAARAGATAALSSERSDGSRNPRSWPQLPSRPSQGGRPSLVVLGAPDACPGEQQPTRPAVRLERSEDET